MIYLDTSYYLVTAEHLIILRLQKLRLFGHKIQALSPALVNVLMPVIWLIVNLRWGQVFPFIIDCCLPINKLPFNLVCFEVILHIALRVILFLMADNLDQSIIFLIF